MAKDRAAALKLPSCATRTKTAISFRSDGRTADSDNAHNVKVSAVAPGIIDTPMYTTNLHDFLNTLQPVGHMGTTRDVADAVLYLSRAEFTTGVVLPVDGGMTSGRF